MDRSAGRPHGGADDAAVYQPKHSLSSLVTRISIDFIHVKPECVDDAIERSLAAVCAYLKARRGFVLMLDDEQSGEFCVVHEWSADDMPASGSGDSGGESVVLPKLCSTLQAGGVFQTCAEANSLEDGTEERAWLKGRGIRSAIVVPMIAENTLVGAFGIGMAASKRGWPTATLALVRVVSDIIVSARARKAAHTALQRRIKAEGVIRSIATMVIGLGADELENGYTGALEVIGQFLEADRCYIRLAGLTDPDTPQLAGWCSEVGVEFDSAMQEYDIFKSFPGTVKILAKSKNVIVNSVAEVPEVAVNEIAFLKRFSVEAMIMTPIYAKERLVGILVTEMNHAPREWSDVDIMLVSIAGQILGGMRVREIVEEGRRHLESQVQHAQKLESMGVLAGGIAHDFNNLLVGILGNAELMLMDITDDHSHRKHLEQIESSARRAGDLVNQLLTYTGKGQFKVEPINVTELMKNLTTLLRTVIPKKIMLQTEFEDDLPMIAGDPVQLRQIIMNLITNASEAVGNIPGKILVCTGFGTFNEEFFRHTAAGDNLTPGDYVIVEVTDTGCGMDEETKAKIFDPFFTTKFAGRGLGLAATIGIVRAHHGAIHVMSWPQKGTTIQVLLPATEYARPEPGKAADEFDPAVDGGTVLVIDDEISVRRVTRSVLEHFGYDVLVAENGLRGLRVLEQNERKIDLIILDMSMPKMDGVETLQRIRELGQDMPIVLTSGYTEVEIGERLGELNAAAFIGKPFSPKDLIQQIRKLL